MRATAAVLALILVLLAAAPAVAQPALGPTGRCEAFSDFLSVAAAVHAPVPILEVEVTLQNNSPGKLRVETGMFALHSRQTGRVSPLTLDEAKAILNDPAQLFAGLVLFGLLGLWANQESQRRWTAHAEANIFKGADLLPDAAGKGSLFFRPYLNLTEFTLSVEGLTGETGQPFPALTTTCSVPTLGGRVASPPPAAVRVYVMTARATSGPLTMSVERAELGKDETAFAVTIENTGDSEANLFNAIADATLTDNAGKTYFVRTLRTNLVDRIGAGGNVKGRFVFEPLLPSTRRATLTMPGIRIGDAAHEISVQLRF